MSLRIGNKVGVGHSKGAPFNWSSYWTTLISATVEDAAPTDVILTFPTGKPSLLATDITCTVNGSARVVSSASWTGAVWTVVLASAVIYGDVVVMTFVKTGQTKAVTNNVAAEAEALTYIGRMSVAPDLSEKRLINILFKSLKTAGTLTKADWIYLTCIHNGTDALLNVVRDAFNMTLEGDVVPIFNPYMGYRGGGTTGVNSKLNLNYVPSVDKINVAQDSCTFIVSEYGRNYIEGLIGHGSRNAAGTSGHELIHSSDITLSKGYFTCSDNNTTEVTGLPSHKSFGIIRRESGKTRKFTDQTFKNESTINSVALSDKGMYFFCSLRNATFSFKNVNGVDYAGMFSGLSDAEYIATDLALRTFVNSMRALHEIIICDGDSLTGGQVGVTLGNTYPKQLNTLFAGTKFVANFGVQARTLTQLEASAALRVDANFNATKLNTLIIWGGVNDFGTELATTKETIYARYKTYCTSRKAAGWTVYALTLLPQSYAGYTGRIDYETERQWFNNQVKTDLITIVDGIIDVAGDARIGDAGDENDTTYYHTDKIHLNNTGSGVIAELVHNALI